MNVKNFNFKQKPKLLINKVEYDFENTLSGEFHIYNKSVMNFKKVWYKDDRDRLKNSIKFPSFSIVELYFGTDLAFFGVKRQQSGIDLNPFRPKHVDITAIDFKEWLTHKPMDFIIYRKSPQWAVEQIVKKLNEKRIVVGQLKFTLNNNIEAYNTKDKTAYDVLRMIERKTQSILQILPNANGEMEINFYSKDSARINKNGVELDLSTKVEALAFYNKYKITKFQAKEDSIKYANQVRVESEKAQFDITTSVEIDLSTTNGQYTLTKPIGIFVKNTAKWIDANGQMIRKLIVVTDEEVSKGKSYDISYSRYSKTITINDKFVNNGTQGKFTFEFYAIGRISYQFDNIPEQQRIAVISDTEGIVHQYEKHNDETTPSDMIALGKGYLAKNNEPKLQLEISSLKPIWDLGEHTVLHNYVTPDIDGEFIVSKLNLEQILDSEGEVITKFHYELINTLNFDEDINDDDPLKYRDNPIFNADELEFASRTDIQEDVFVIVENFKCVVKQILPDGVSHNDLSTDLAVTLANDNAPTKRKVGK